MASVIERPHALGRADILILKKIDQPGFDTGFWRIDDVQYPDGTDLKGALISAFTG